jgi:long-subunit acyl-CoA synthetase (AMP-forming)
MLMVPRERLVATVAFSSVHFAARDERGLLQVLHEVGNSNPVSRSLFHTAFNSKRAALAAGKASGGSFAPLWNSLVFSKVKAKLGGRVRLLTTGASPISADVMAFLRVCFPGATVLEGYGARRTPFTFACITCYPHG